jgi:hypothetical protein
MERQAIDDEVSTLTKSTTKMSECMLEIHPDLTIQMKELHELIISINRSSRKTTTSPNSSKRYKKLYGDRSISSSSSEGDGRWAYKCDSCVEMSSDDNGIEVGSGPDRTGDH